MDLIAVRAGCTFTGASIYISMAGRLLWFHLMYLTISISVSYDALKALSEYHTCLMH